VVEINALIRGHGIKMVVCGRPLRIIVMVGLHGEVERSEARLRKAEVPSAGVMMAF
jgi:hypothetical protein